MAMQVGELIWKISGDKSEFDKTSKQAEKQAKGLGEKFKGLGKIIAGAFAVQAIFKFGKALIKAGSEAQDVGIKFGITFRGITEEANEMAKNLAKNYGISITESKKLLGNTGDLLTGFGMQRTEALNLSNQVQELAADLASLNSASVTTQQASEALTKGLFGEVEGLKTLGISIRQDTDEYKNALKVKMENEGLTLQQAKAQVILKMAIEQSGNAIGSTQKKMLTWSGIQRRMNARTEDFMAELGQRLLPGLEKLGNAFLDLTGEGDFLVDILGWLVDGASQLMGFIADLLSGIVRFVKYVKKEFGPAIDIMVKGFKLAVKYGTPLLGILSLITGKKKEAAEEDDKEDKKQDKRAKRVIRHHKKEKKVIEEKTSALDEFKKKLEEVAGTYASGLGQVENLFSSITDLSSAVGERRINELDAQMEKELEAAGLLEETKQQKLQAEIEQAEALGDAQTANEKKKALERLKIEEKYAKKKAMIEYEVANMQWGFQLAMAVAQLPLMIMQGMSSGWAIPMIGAIMGPIYGALAGAAGAIQIASVAAAKPKKPSFQTGGIVAGNMGSGDAIAAQVNSGEMILNSSQQARLFDMADGRGGGGAGNITIYIGEDQIYDNLYEATKNGELLIDTRAVKSI